MTGPRKSLGKGNSLHNVLDAQSRSTPINFSQGAAEFTEAEGFSGQDGYFEEPAMEMATSTVETQPTAPSLSKDLQFRLFTSHFLSTWNSRAFEFGAILFLASIYPQTLRPMSIYALLRSAAAILFAQPVGTWIDRRNRLAVVRASIIGQRLAVAISCGLFWVMEIGVGGIIHDHLLNLSLGRGNAAMNALFAVVVLLACVEKVCSMMNLVAVERDWVVVITDGNDMARRVLNARMRRIDLFCKLLAPLTISSIALASTLIAIWTLLAMNLLSVVVEYIFIAQVYKSVPVLRQPGTSETEPTSADPASCPSLTTETALQTATKWLKRAATHALRFRSLPFYFRHSACLPSLSLAMLYFTVLSFSGQMITYLISVGYTSLYVGVARTVATCFELSATWVAPWMMKRIGIVRGGIWSLSWQMMWLAAGLSWFFARGRDHGLDTTTISSATGLAVGVALSRVGLWGYDLCAQNIVQDEVGMGHRGTFSTVEAAFQNLFEMLSSVLTIIFSRPDQFQWPVVVSTAAVYTAGGMYAVFVRKRRGHLFHAPPCVQDKTNT